MTEASPQIIGSFVKGQSALWYQVNECVFVVCCFVLRVNTDTLIYTVRRMHRSECETPAY
jgi:hypothetical protein